MIAVNSVSESTSTKLAATPPISTVALGVNPDPMIVTGVPPSLGPDFGLIEVTVGAGACDGGEVVTYV